ncbi:MAG: hypothetical protein AB7H77_11755 [Bdellovibrionales bacterium]
MLAHPPVNKTKMAGQEQEERYGLMKSYILRYVAVFAATALLALASPATNPAFADCASPSAEEGVMMYNTTYKTMQFCDGNNWYSMKAVSSGSGGGIANQSDCMDGDGIFFDSASSGFRCPDKTPDTFSFTDQSDVAVSTIIQSNIFQITGIETGVTVSIIGDGSPEFRICNDNTCAVEVFTWGGANRTVSGGQFLQLRMTSNATSATTQSVTVTVGSAASQWQVTTALTYSYTAWSGWSSCSASCGGGTQSHTRSCLRNDGLTVDCSFCGGVCSENQSCNTQSCCHPLSGQPCADGCGTYDCNGICQCHSPCGACAPGGDADEATSDLLLLENFMNLPVVRGAMDLNKRSGKLY